MSDKDSSLPDGMTPVAPHLTVAGAAEALDFYVRAFGAEEMMRLPGEDGRIMHAAMRINGGAIMLHDEYPEMGALGPKARGGSSVVIHLSVPDAAAAEARALAAGSTSVMKVARQFWGDDYGQVEDPFGHRWSFGSPGEAKTVEEIAEAARHVG